MFFLLLVLLPIEQIMLLKGSRDDVLYPNENRIRFGGDKRDRTISSVAAFEFCNAALGGCFFLVMEASISADKIFYKVALGIYMLMNLVALQWFIRREKRGKTLSDRQQILLKIGNGILYIYNIFMLLGILDKMNNITLGILGVICIVLYNNCYLWLLLLEDTEEKKKIEDYTMQPVKMIDTQEYMRNKIKTVKKSRIKAAVGFMLFMLAVTVLCTSTAIPERRWLAIVFYGGVCCIGTAAAIVAVKKQVKQMQTEEPARVYKGKAKVVSGTPLVLRYRNEDGTYVSKGCTRRRNMRYEVNSVVDVIIEDGKIACINEKYII